jgi:hypothetical protein
MADEKATVLNEAQTLAYVDAIRTARSVFRCSSLECDALSFFAEVIEGSTPVGMSDRRVVQYILTRINSQVQNKDAATQFLSTWPRCPAVAFSEEDIQMQERFLTSKGFDTNYLRQAVMNPEILGAAKPEFETPPRVEGAQNRKQKEMQKEMSGLIEDLEHIVDDMKQPVPIETKPLPGKIPASPPPEEESHNIRNALIILTTIGTLLGLDGGLNNWSVSKSLFATPAGNFQGVDVPSGVWIGVCALAVFAVAAWCKSRIHHEDPPALESTIKESTKSL